jgi:hypothetical protein
MEELVTRHLDKVAAEFPGVLRDIGAAKWPAASQKCSELCDAPHTPLWSNHASTRHAGCEMGCTQLMT